MSSGTIEFDSVVSDNAKILILKQITTTSLSCMSFNRLCLIMQRY